MKPSPETCRQLTLYLGECWHLYDYPYDPYCLKCGAERKYKQRTFTIPADLFAVFGEMVERGEWAKFEQCQWDKSHTPHKDGEFTAWLFCLSTPDQIGERLAMAARWIKEKGK